LELKDRIQCELPNPSYILVVFAILPFSSQPREYS